MKATAILMLLPFLLLFAGCGDDSSESGQFKANVHNFVSDKPLSGVKVWALNNTTGEKLPNVDPQVSDGSGWVVFNNLPDEEVGFLCEGEGAGTSRTKADTYQFNIDSGAQDEKLWSVDGNTYNVAPLGAHLNLDATKGVAAGAVYWVNDSGEEEIVGCATVKTKPEGGEARYFTAARLPVPIEDQSVTDTSTGYFLVGNISVGDVDLEAYVGETKIGSVHFVVKPDSICIGNIYAERSKFTANPMPASCK